MVLMLLVVAIVRRLPQCHAVTCLHLLNTMIAQHVIIATVTITVRLVTHQVATLVVIVGVVVHIHQVVINGNV